MSDLRISDLAKYFECRRRLQLEKDAAAEQFIVLGFVDHQPYRTGELVKEIRQNVSVSRRTILRALKNMVEQRLVKKSVTGHAKVLYAQVI
jgi:DNA-binding PadR family transcriptional regulator